MVICSVVSSGLHGNNIRLEWITFFDLNHPQEILAISTDNKLGGLLKIIIPHSHLMW